MLQLELALVLLSSQNSRREDAYSNVVPAILCFYVECLFEVLDSFGYTTKLSELELAHLASW